MKFFVCVLSLAVCLGTAAAGRPSNNYLPPNFAAVGAGGSSQYPRYHGVSGSSVGGGHGGGHGGGGSHQYAAAASAPVYSASSQYGHNSAAAQIPTLRNDYTNDGSGNYNFGFETGNGIKRDETGEFVGGWPGGALEVQGSYSYTGDDGKVYSVNYKADSNGFHAEGDHLPTPPPIPREIQETLHLHQRGNNQQGSSGSYNSPASYGGSSGSYNSPSSYGGQSGYSGGGGAGGHFASASHQSAARAPPASYLPPQQGQGYNYNKRH